MWVTTELCHFQDEMAHISSTCTQNFTDIAKSIAYIINELGGDFQQGSCLYKTTGTFNRHLSTRECLTDLRNKLQKSISMKFWQ